MLTEVEVDLLGSFASPEDVVAEALGRVIIEDGPAQAAVMVAVAKGALLDLVGGSNSAKAVRAYLRDILEVDVVDEGGVPSEVGRRVEVLLDIQEGRTDEVVLGRVIRAFDVVDLGLVNGEGNFIEVIVTKRVRG